MFICKTWQVLIFKIVTIVTIFDSVKTIFLCSCPKSPEKIQEYFLLNPFG